MTGCIGQLRSNYPEVDFEIAFGPDKATNSGVIGVNALSRGRMRLYLSSIVPDHLQEIIASRFVDMLPLLTAFSLNRDETGFSFLNLGDEAHRPGWTFCMNGGPEYILIPDCIFIALEGYRRYEDRLRTMPVSWEERPSKAFWRGSSTGHSTGSIMTLPRVQLCLLSRSEQAGGLIDAAITHIVQERRDEIEHLHSLGIVQSYQDWDDTVIPKYQIDIDGRTNSWPGLFRKLMTGSPVLKIESPGGYRQWYYDQLKPWVNYVPVKQDLSDLIDKLKCLDADEQLARRIGASGRALCVELTYDKSIAQALPAMAKSLQAEADS